MQASIYSRIKASSPRPHAHTCGHATPYLGIGATSQELNCISKTPQVSLTLKLSSSP
jgi:hypothetical protein